MKEITIKTYLSEIHNNHKYDLTDEYLYVDGKQYKLPKNSQFYFLKVVNDKVYVNHYEFKNEQFKPSLTAFIYKLFRRRK